MVLIVAFILHRVVSHGYFLYRNRIVTLLGKQVLEERNANKYDFSSHISHLDIEAILELDVRGLREGLMRGDFTSVDLVNLFAERSYRIGRRLCMSGQENFEEATKMAKKRDQERRKARLSNSENELPLMHGIPISVKDQIDQKGKFTSVGLAYLCSDVAREDSPIVELYLKAGAIPLVRGNCAMGAMAIHTKNLVFGETLNPLNTQRSCGGSSGGDSGLVAARCVPLGVGIDVGGSIRIPAAFTGICGFKPS